MNQKLVNFYTKGGKDNKDRRLSGILNAGNEYLEWSHDYIQWVFPTKTKSQFNADAPVLDDETIAELISSPVFHKNFEKSIQRLKSFWFNGDKSWMQAGDHNLLRMSRFMESCYLLGHEDSALDLFERLDYISTQENGKFISETNLKYWKKSCGL